MGSCSLSLEPALNQSPHVREYKTVSAWILDSGLWTVDSGFQLVDSGCFVSGTLDSGFQSLVRFQIPQAEYIQDSAFHKQNFPDSKFTNNFSDFGIQVALHKAKTELSSICLPCNARVGVGLAIPATQWLIDIITTTWQSCD